MGWTLAFARLAFAASEYASLHWPTKKLAALAALAAGGGYMVLTGMQVPIVRSFAMACLYTVAVLAGRRAISLRGLALAAMVLMLLEPQEVPGVSFQMSFSAVLALIAGYEALRPALRALHGSGGWPRRFASHLAALALTSALAGTASAPFGAYHFGRIQVYFVVANMIAVPLTALWVMPAGLIALLLMPFGLDWLAFVPMGWGVEAILYVARTTAAWPAATFDVPHMPPWGLAVTASRHRLARPLAEPAAADRRAGDRARPGIAAAGATARSAGVGRRAADRRAHAGHGLSAAVSGASRFTRDAWLQYWAAGSPVADARSRARRPTAPSRAGKEACLLRPVPDAKARAAGARRDASGRLSRGVGDRLGGAGARSVPAAMAGAGRSLHGVALRRDRDLAGRLARAHRDRSRLSRRSALGAAAADTARPRCAAAAAGADGIAGASDAELVAGGIAERREGRLASHAGS